MIDSCMTNGLCLAAECLMTVLIFVHRCLEMPTIPVISMVDVEMNVTGAGFLPSMPLFETLMRSMP